MNSYELSTLDEIKDRLMAEKCTVAIAESVTSGMIQHAFSQVQDAMKIFQGGITTYNLGQKTSLLAVDPIEAMACNCVSEQVACEMAVEVAKKFRSQFGLAVTGYASPVPELNIKNLFAYYAISKKKNIIGKGRIDYVASAKFVEGDAADPQTVQCHFTNKVLRIFLSLIK